MGRMYSRAKGKSKSHPPLKPEKPTWIRVESKEVELLVGKLAKEGKSASEIGLILRDSYGIPSVKLLTGKKVQQILEEKKLSSELPEDLYALMRRATILRKHLKSNHKDTGALRGLQLTESKINRLVKYYKEKSKLPEDWKYDPANVKIYV
ncbi:30S ribosomal protein S15 [Candidatus Woesearchaeota archaeon]|nr:MAG: 30S ribosomal protein S15 [Candidatus Woesearchaeota archaeon]